MKKRILTVFLALAAFAVFAVGAQAMDGTAGAHGSMGAHAMTPVEDLTPAANPLYPVGSEVVIETDHMAGMQGARGVVSGAFDATLYAVDYVSDAGEAIRNHRWVIAGEIEGRAGRAFAVGDRVTLGEGHMGGLGGAGKAAVIVRAVAGPAYMVDYDPTDGGARVVNHQWVAEFELKPADPASSGGPN